MKFLKFIALILVFVMAVSVVSVYAEGDAVQTVELSEEYNLVYDLGMRRTFSEQVTRGEFCAALADILGYRYGVDNYGDDGVYPFPDVIPGMDSFNAVKAFNSLGIVKGDGNGMFNPDSPITVIEAATIIIRVLGMEVMADEVGYLQYANRKGILRDVKLASSDCVSEADTVKMFYNMLMTDIKISSLNNYGGTWEYFYNMLGLKFVSGNVSDDGEVSYSGESEVDSNEIVVDGVTYVNKTGKVDLLAQNIEGYYTTSSDGTKTIISLIATNKDAVVIDAKDLDKYSDYVYSAVEDNGRKKDYKLAPDFVLIYNNRPVKFDADLTDEKFNEIMKPKTGSVTIYKGEDGSYSIVRIKSYINIVVKNTSFADDLYKVYDKYGENDLIITDKEAEVSVKNIGGNKIEKNMVKAEDVISYAQSYDKKYCEIIVSNSVKNDIVSVLGDDYAKISEQNYEFAWEYANRDSVSNNVATGKISKIYLNYQNDIVYIESNSTNGLYAVMGDYIVESGFNDNVKLRVYTENGNCLELKTNNKLIVDGRVCKGKDEIIKAFDNKNIRFNAEENNYVVVNIDYIEKGNDLILKSIDTPYYMREYDASFENADSLHYIKNIKSQSGSVYPYFNNSFSGHFSIDTATVVFCIPRDVKDISDVSVSSMTKISSNGSSYDIKNYNVSAYTHGENKLCAEAVVFERYTNGLDFRNFNYNPIAKIGVVTQICDSLNDEGDIVNTIYIEDGNKVYSYQTEDMEVLNYSSWASKGDKVEVGDIVRYVVDSDDKIIHYGGIFSMYDYSEKKVIAVAEYTTNADKFSANSRKRLLKGYVNTIGNGYIEICEDVIAGPIDYETKSTVVLPTEGLPVMIYDTEKDQTELGTLQEINSYVDDPYANNEIFAIVNEMKPMLLLVYR